MGTTTRVASSDGMPSSKSIFASGSGSNVEMISALTIWMASSLKGNRASAPRPSRIAG